MPIALYQIAMPEIAGHLMIAARPRGGAALAGDVAAWRERGITGVVSLLDSDEAAEAGLGNEAATCQAAGIAFLSVPVTDLGVPSPTVLSETVPALAARVVGGETLAFHCYAGLGRSPTLAACVLVELGVAPDEALRRIAAARGRPVPETAAQHALVMAYRRSSDRG
jgi:protein-tyrosine phosphatase